jgi:hypothetical protein
MGPDGFPIHFYQDCWPIIKSDLKRMLIHPQKKKKQGQVQTSPS